MCYNSLSDIFLDNAERFMFEVEKSMEGSYQMYL